VFLFVSNADCPLQYSNYAGLPNTSERRGGDGNDYDYILIANIATSMRDGAVMVNRVSWPQNVVLITDPNLHLALQHDPTLLAFMSERNVARIAAGWYHSPHHLDIAL
jgi:hypothetical protein